MNKLQAILETADIHASRIQMAVSKLTDIFPLQKDQVNSLSQEHLLLIELLTSRFAKLQDLIGQKIFDEFLILKSEKIDGLTMIDKLHKLERIGVIPDTQIWQEMRYARNHISHEYPHNPEITARYLNKIFDLTPVLLGVLNNILAHI